MKQCENGHIYDSVTGSDGVRISLGHAQNCGTREHQEDSFGYTPTDKIGSDGLLAAVADGMGGLSDGDKASSYVVDSLLDMRDLINGRNIPDKFRRMVSQLNYDVFHGGTGGCTLAAVYCCSGGVYWCSVGDSRIYLYRGGMLFQLTEDSNYQNQLLDDVISGTLSFAEVTENEKKESLVHYIGSKSEPVPDVNIRPLVPRSGDKLLICSDGVYNALSDGEIAHVLTNPAQQAADALESAIVDKNHADQDNSTMIVLEFIQERC